MTPREIFGLMVRIFGLIIFLWGLAYFVSLFAIFVGVLPDNIKSIVKYFGSGVIMIVIGLGLMRWAPPFLEGWAYPRKDL